MVQLKRTLGTALQKINKTINLIYMIDVLEQKQEVADYLEEVNTENEDEQERKRQCREAIAACLKEIHEHCLEYLSDHPENACYVDWIRLCHPDNVECGKLDRRFYVRDSDHRIIWNSYCDMQNHPERKIKHLYEQTLE